MRTGLAFAIAFSNTRFHTQTMKEVYLELQVVGPPKRP